MKKCVAAASLAVTLAVASACSDGTFPGTMTSPSATSTTVANHESGGANPTVFITDNGLQPRKLEVSTNAPVTFVNRSSVNRWIRSDPHEPTGHNECSEFEAIGILAPGESGTTGILLHERCDYHDHLMGENLTSDFEGEVRVRDDD
jgi:hypothetical protein